MAGRKVCTAIHKLSNAVLDTLKLDPWDVAVQRIVEAGTPCTIAAGNDGERGFFMASGAADAIGAISVGSVDNIDFFAELVAGSSTTNGTTAGFGYLPGNFGDFGNVAADLYAISLNTVEAADACSPLPASTPNLASYVVLIRRGTCTFDIKVANVRAFGATKVLFYNNLAGAPIAPGSTSPDIPAGMVSNLQGAKWISQLTSGLTVNVKFTQLELSGSFIEYWPNTNTGGMMSYFSSWGPTYEMYIKPAVSAPGGSILSTIPLKQGGYGVLSGTSMATPYIAGVVALMKQIRGKAITPQEIIGRLATTATPLNLNDGGGTKYPNLAPVIQQGGGLLDAYAAIHSKTTLDIEVIALNDTTYFKAPHPFTIQNTGSSPVTYTLSNIGALTTYGIHEVEQVPESFLPTLISANATIRFEPSTITIPANSAGVVTAHFTRPANLLQSRLPIYGGYIGITGSNGEFLTLPYAGAAAELKATELMGGTYGGFLLDSSTDDLVKDFNFTFAKPNSTYIPTRYPQAYISLSMGSSLCRVDIIPRDVHNLPRYVGEQALGPLPGTPWRLITRAFGYEQNWDGKLENGSYAPAGEYRFLIRPLRLNGDPARAHDYEEKYTEYFWISYK